MKFQYLFLCVLGSLFGSSYEKSLASSKVRETYNVVFAGDSLTSGWKSAGSAVWTEYFEPLNAGNVGVSGYKTTDILDAINSGAYDDLEAKVIVLMIGGNDLQIGTTGVKVAENIRTILDLVLAAKPGVRFLLLGLLPGGAPEAVVEQGMIAREIISGYDDGGVTVKYLDMSEHFGTPEGVPFDHLYQDDKIHLREAGYQVWAENMTPVLVDMLNEKQVK